MFPAVKDAHGTLADALGAKTDARSRCRGRAGRDLLSGTHRRQCRCHPRHHHDLTNALNSVLKGEPVAQPTVMAFGCAIRRDAAAVVAAKGVPTYSHDVASILRAKCESCHRTGEVAPFTLQDYKQASAWASDIKRYTQNGQMPPWKPDANYGAFKDVAAHTLSDQEKTVLAKWADAGAPLGNPKEIPAPGEVLLRLEDGNAGCRDPARKRVPPQPGRRGCVPQLRREDQLQRRPLAARRGVPSGQSRYRASHHQLHRLAAPCRQDWKARITTVSPAIRRPAAARASGPTASWADGRPATIPANCRRASERCCPKARTSWFRCIITRTASRKPT